MLKKLINRGYKKAGIYGIILETFDIKREDIPTENNEPKCRNPLTLTCNNTLPNVKEAVKKHWNILQINSEFNDHQNFQNHQLCASVETKI